MNDLYKIIEDKIGVINNIKRLSVNSYIIYASNIYFLKKTDKNNDYIFNYLKNQNVNNVIYPEYEFIYNNELYYIFLYIHEYDYPMSKKVIDLKNALMEMHSKTSIKRKIKKKEYKKLYRVYLILDNKFKILESLVRKSEANIDKNDIDWIILSKYYIYLDCKKEMYELQKKIHKFIDDKIEIYYSILHNKPSINHLIDQSLINFDDSKIGFVVSDIAKYFVLNEYIDIDFKNEIEEWINIYESDFYKIYFKFLVLYIYMLNLKIDNDILTIDSYILISSKIKKVLNTF